MIRQANVYCNGVLAGTLLNEKDGAFQFRYNQSFLLDDKQTAIACAFPKTQRTYTSDTLFPFFFNMLSEGANKHVQCKTLKIDEDDSFGLLLATAHTDTIGAITVKSV